MGTFAVWLVLFGIVYEYLPGFGRTWGFNLLRYLPDWAGWLLVVVGLLAATEEARRGAIRAARALGARVRAIPSRPREAGLYLVSLAVFWGVHEKVLLGDSILLVVNSSADGRPAYPETGGAMALWLLFHGADAIGLPMIPTVRLLACALGAAAVVWVVRGARLAAPDNRAAAAIPLLAFSGGLMAALAGRIEIQAGVVAIAAAYLSLGLRFLAPASASIDPPDKGGSALRAPALVLGLLIWVEPYCLLLLPGLLLLPKLAGRGRVLPALGYALLPLALHLAFLLAVNPKDLPMATIVGRALGSAQGFVRVTGDRSRGTDYFLLSLPHLKYLANAAFVLVPAALPTVITLFIVLRKRALATSPVRFLAASTGGILVATVAVRPVWGPFDWDLFSVTALCLAFLAGSLLALLDGDSIRTHLVAAAVGLQITFVAIPLLVIGQGDVIAAGPFTVKHFDVRLYRTGKPPPRRVSRWL